MFDVQMMGGIVLHEGDIAEMKTGEGKTFVAALALYLNGLPGTGVHLVTTNDYLAKRDAEWNRPVFERLGMTVGYIQNMMPFAERREAYAADITYGTNSEFGFDYLRDNMAVYQGGPGPAQPLLRDRGRGRLDPDRRGTDSADHLRRARDGRDDLLRLRAHRQGADRRAGDAQEREGRGRDRALRRRLPLRREAQDRLPGAEGNRHDRARARAREPLRPTERAAREPPDPGAEGRVALPA